MKRIFLILLIAVGFVFWSCKKDSVPNQNSTDQNQSTGNQLPENIFANRAQWLVVSLMKNGTEESMSFNSSQIFFDPDNSFTISNDVLSANGKWVFTGIDQPNPYLNLTFDSQTSAIENWSDFADNWKVNAFTATNLLLQSQDNSKMMTLQKLGR